MATAPYGVRLLLGAATIAVEETCKLPKNLLMYPMTLASQAAHAVMLMQQNLAELAIKGDATLETLFPPKDEQPEWAIFDEDLDEDPDLDAPDDAPGSVADGTAVNGERRTEGRFALYSAAEGEAEDQPVTKPETKPGKAAAASTTAPPVVTDLNYPALTLAQVRARMQSLGVDELEALLAYEDATRARAPFQTLLANRITRTTAK